MATELPEYSVSISRIYKINADAIFDLFRNNTAFKLTAADIIESDFRTDGEFHLTFKSRGIIYGHFIEIKNHRILIDWNVNGFGRPDEKNTRLEIKIIERGDYCRLELIHQKIKSEEASEAKRKAWEEILADLEIVTSAG